MKKIFLIIPLLIIAFVLSAQSYQFVYEETVLAHGDTIVYEAEASLSEVVIEIDVKNISEDTVTTLAKRNVISEAAGITNAFCWSVCYSITTDVAVREVDIAPGETSNEFSGHIYNENALSGELFIQYTIFNANDANDSVSVYVHYKIGDVNSLTNEITNSPEIKLFPNPVNDQLSIKGIRDYERMIIYNQLGQKVIEQSIFGNLQRVDVSGLESGLYFVELSGKIGETGNLKFLK